MTINSLTRHIHTRTNKIRAAIYGKLLANQESLIVLIHLQQRDENQVIKFYSLKNWSFGENYLASRTIRNFYGRAAQVTSLLSLGFCCCMPHAICLLDEKPQFTRDNWTSFQASDSNFHRLTFCLPIMYVVKTDVETSSYLDGANGKLLSTLTWNASHVIWCLRCASFPGSLSSWARLDTYCDSSAVTDFINSRLAPEVRSSWDTSRMTWLDVLNSSSTGMVPRTSGRWSRARLR